MARLILLHSIQPSEMDRAVLRLADWMGVESKAITNSNQCTLREQLEQAARNGQVCVAAGADTLAERSELSEIVHVIAECGGERVVPMLVYGIGRSPSHITLLEKLGCRSIKGVHHVQKQSLRYTFAAERKIDLQQLAGQEFSDETSGGCDVFEIVPSAEDEVVPLLSAEDHPVFIRTQAGRGKIDLYLWATNRIADVGKPASCEAELACMYQWLLPAMVYLKAGFGSRCWHNPNVRARLIIDDPLLHSQYGFLNYDELFNSMRRVSYGTSLAFIPWNYRRSHRQVADLFQASKNLLSLCVHGCDHAKHEFDSDDEAHLTQIASLALQRMNRHYERSRVLHENVMVFPQGEFSSVALRALRRSGFVAAVNTSCFPSREEVELPLGDLMRPAVCRFHGFPIFLRRGPNRIIDIAVDLFVGRAGFVVEHHEFVRQGYGNWEQFVVQMNALDARLTWDSLLDTVTEACLQKVAGDAEMEIQFFTPVFKWMNQLDRPVLARFSKFEPDPILIKKIRVNGKERPFHAADGHVHFDVEVETKALIAVEILDKEVNPILPFKPSLGHQIFVGARRLLSEFRDNMLARHPIWFEQAKGIARYLRRTYQ